MEPRAKRQKAGKKRARSSVVGSAERGALPAAVAMLARRALSSAEVRERLSRAFGADEAGRAVARLLELRVLDDSAYAERFVRDRFERAGYGSERIRADLEARGVGRADIETAIAIVIDAARERASAARALARFRRLKGARADPRRLPEAAFRHLTGKGFPFELIRDLLAGSL